MTYESLQQQAGLYKAGIAPFSTGRGGFGAWSTGGSEVRSGGGKAMRHYLGLGRHERRTLFVPMAKV